MNERQRAQYLEAMGIDSFVPRFVLPAAKAPVMLQVVDVASDVDEADVAQLDQVQESGAAADTTADTTSSPVPVRDILKAHMETVTESPPSTEPQSPVAVVDAETVEERASVKPARFSLSLWRAGKDVQVIDSRQQGDALPTHKLLSNILQALSVLDLNLPKEEILRWPMVENSPHQGWEEARAMVNGFLEARLLDNPVTLFLLFGQDAFHAMFGEHEDFDSARYQHRTIEDFSARAIVLPSLAEILYTPGLKRPVWQTLNTSLAKGQFEEQLVSQRSDLSFFSLGRPQAV
eukprot:TRINITY_DN71301_c0_g3_i1.p1 TRINITY_DN71301_c0_g3~~TRINITY_DN71301_c0_g3_i1.p1  ORF type:complete len:302 (-),score=27.34 TRINITY_DN71301_c0_g3_i1:39-911(-)